MKTDRLYYKDQYLKEFEGTVLRCEKTKKGWETVLERTAFYPEGGGQPGDTGTLGGVRVLDTYEKDDEIVQLCAGELSAGETVRGEIDWERRFDLMQQHSGEHILSGIVHRKFGYDNVGFHMGADVMTIDFSGYINHEQLREIELETNEAVWKNFPIEVSYPDEKELSEMEFRSKKELHGWVRIVSCGGYDTCACCGTHVSHTGEVGLVKILSSQKFHDGVRIELVAGKRAFLHLEKIFEQNRAVSAMLSAKQGETAKAARRLAAEMADTKYKMVGYEDELFALAAKDYAGAEKALCFKDGLSPDGVRKLCVKIMEVCPGVCAVFSGDDEAGYKYAMGRADAETVKAMNAALSGRGGGKAGFAQGTVTAKRENIEKFFTSKGSLV